MEAKHIIARAFSELSQSVRNISTAMEGVSAAIRGGLSKAIRKGALISANALNHNNEL